MRRPIFWFLWPAPEPGPVDEQAVQARWLRVCGRGPWRWAFLIVASAVVATVVSAAAAATLARPGILTVMLTVLIAAPLVALLARAWVAGTYVNDRGIKVSGVLTTQVIPWSAVEGIDTDPRSRLLGLPLRMPGAGARIRWSQGATATHIESLSPDLWLRPQSYDAARERLITWHRETR